MKKLLILFITIFFLTGCYNYTELSDLSVVSSILIDYKDEYLFSVEIYEDEETKIINGSGNTLADALNDIYNKSNKTIYLAHLNAILFTKNVNIDEIILYFLRNPDINNNFYLVQINNTDIYSKENIGESIKYILDKKKYPNFFNIASDYINNTKDILVPFYKDKKINAYALYKNNNFINIIEEKDADVLNIFLNIDNQNIYTKCDGGYFVVNIDSSKTKYKINKDINIDVTVYGSISEYNCKLNTMKAGDINKLEGYAKKEINKELTFLINSLKENKIDTLGLNTKIKNKYHKLDKEFYQYDISVETNIHIFKKGFLLK